MVVSGYVVIEPSHHNTIGSHDLVIWLENLVTMPFNVTYSIFVEHVVTNFTFTADEFYVTPGTTVTFSLTAQKASRFQMQAFYDYVYNDTWVYEEQYVPLLVHGSVHNVRHAFQVVDNCTVNMTLVNNVSSAWYTAQITVQNPVRNMTLSTNSPIPLLKGASQSDLSLTIQFTNTGKVPEPTNAVYEYVFGNTRPGENETLKKFSAFTLDSNDQVIDQHPYYAVGTYVVTMNISNFVSFIYDEQRVDVDEPVMDLLAWADPPIINATADTTVHVNMTWGSRTNVTWDWLDPNSANTVEFYTFWHDTKMQTHAWQDSGVFPVLVTAENTLRAWNTTIEVPVIVQWPIVEVYTECPMEVRISYANNWRADYHCQIYIAKGFAPPTNVTVFVNWGDQYEVNGTKHYYTSGPTALVNNMSAPGFHRLQNGKLGYLYSEFVHPMNYVEGDTYWINFTMQNLVSQHSESIKHRIIEKIVDIEFYPTMIKWLGDDYNFTKGGQQNESEHIGYAPDQEEPPLYFPLEYELAVYVHLYKGSHIYFDWDFDDDSGNLTVMDVYR